MDGKTFDTFAYDGMVSIITIKGGDGKDISYSVVTDSKEKGNCIIWFIHTKPNMRRQGYASDIINHIKQRFLSISTPFLDSSEEGKAFLYNNGFARHGSMLRWESDGKPTT